MRFVCSFRGNMEAVYINYSSFGMWLFFCSLLQQVKGTLRDE